MMRVLITGSSGFVGKHLLNELAASGHETLGMDIAPAASGPAPHHFIPANITDPAAVTRIVAETAPDACIHLAAWAFVGGGNPRMIMDINLMGAMNVFEAFRLAQSKARILFISTAHVYGMTARPDPIREEDPLRPDSLYALAKAAADNLALLYARLHGLNIMVARPHNHIGPGQSTQFAIPAFARQAGAIRQGAAPLIKVGNLDNRRDFTDVRDIAHAYRLILEKGHPGKAYNLASGREARIGDILDRLCQLAGIQPDIVRDESLYRPLDQNPVLDITRLREDTGWAPRIPLDQTLADILEGA